MEGEQHSLDMEDKAGGEVEPMRKEPQSLELLAHSENDDGQVHLLKDHLLCTANKARNFANSFQAGELAYWIGLWHDIGKANPDWQKYLKLSSENKPCKNPGHKKTGIQLALQKEAYGIAAFIIAGHHGGLPSKQDLIAISYELKALEIETATEFVRQLIDNIIPQDSINNTIPGWLSSFSDHKAGKRKLEFFIRMLFSALVDADFIDTESHFQPGFSGVRKVSYEMECLWNNLKEEVKKFQTGGKKTDLNKLRNDIYEECITCAESEPGLFRLTVPTGGGKTLSGMAFALRHALRNNLKRVIVALPYTSIIEQNAEVYRNIFKDGNIVLEHHSSLKHIDENEGFDWIRLASENWDAPIIVTTTVQLFESLFSNKPSSCRKLHNIAGSIIILDEVQTLSPGLLTSTLEILQELADNYGCTIVFSTATQPALDMSPAFKGLSGIREIIKDPSRYFNHPTFKRVKYEIHTGPQQWNLENVADEMLSEKQSLCILNTKKDSIKLFEILKSLNAESMFYLSSLLCPVHRNKIQKEIRKHLKHGQACRLVSTQVVEAGVNLDFPLVLRAIGPLDRIIQAAGRCNREGLLPGPGRVVIFELEEGGHPPGSYKTGMQEAQILFKRDDIDLHDPEIYKAYFQRLYSDINLDSENVQSARESLDFPEVAGRYRLIKEDTVPVVVRWKDDTDKIDKILRIIYSSGRAAMRELQPYLVNIFRRDLSRLQAQGFVSPLIDDSLWEWTGRYDDSLGIVEAPRDPSDLIQ